jgi:hypothetical protein
LFLFQLLATLRGNLARPQAKPRMKLLAHPISLP